MKTSLSTKFVAAAMLAVAALGATSAAHARSDVYFSIGVQVPGVYVQPQPVYVQPAPVYVQPRPVYGQPGPVYVQPPPYGYVFEDDRYWRRAEWERRHWRHHHRDWDHDRGHDRGHGRD